ncbi:hypothetical protein E2C01_022725 [Portunus trituberculatus]|uniref:Uncharacterized protein n=1 Tax=Portunus trituberculatus TaxID=210409 RepID=A0A5B7E6S8_PORTR|nr:hypothetical protein [Portunus trituberculatus]
MSVDIVRSAFSHCRQQQLINAPSLREPDRRHCLPPGPVSCALKGAAFDYWGLGVSPFYSSSGQGI